MNISPPSRPLVDDDEALQVRLLGEIKRQKELQEKKRNLEELLNCRVVPQEKYLAKTAEEKQKQRDFEEEFQLLTKRSAALDQEIDWAKEALKRLSRVKTIKHTPKKVVYREQVGSGGSPATTSPSSMLKIQSSPAVSYSTPRHTPTRIGSETTNPSHEKAKTPQSGTKQQAPQRSVSAVSAITGVSEAPTTITTMTGSSSGGGALLLSPEASLNFLREDVRRLCFSVSEDEQKLAKGAKELEEFLVEHNSHMTELKKQIVNLSSQKESTMNMLDNAVKLAKRERSAIDEWIPTTGRVLGGGDAVAKGKAFLAHHEEERRHQEENLMNLHEVQQSVIGADPQHQQQQAKKATQPLSTKSQQSSSNGTTGIGPSVLPIPNAVGHEERLKNYTGTSSRRRDSVGSSSSFSTINSSLI